MIEYIYIDNNDKVDIISEIILAAENRLLLLQDLKNKKISNDISVENSPRSIDGIDFEMQQISNSISFLQAKKNELI